MGPSVRGKFSMRIFLQFHSDNARLLVRTTQIKHDSFWIISIPNHQTAQYRLAIFVCSCDFVPVQQGPNVVGKFPGIGQSHSSLHFECVLSFLELVSQLDYESSADFWLLCSACLPWKRLYYIVSCPSFALKIIEFRRAKNECFHVSG